jgi:putative membrane protein insertion efficiency factor
MKKQIREVRVADLISYTIVPPLVAAALWLVCCLAVIPSVDSAYTWIVYLATALLSYLPTKRFLIGLVLLYKIFAPLKMRGECRFQPTCSTYMILAIQKYGILIGVYKGVRRILRCKPPNGGVDYP